MVLFEILLNAIGLKIHRTQGNCWMELKLNFAEITDPQHALMLLRNKVKHGQGESIHIFAQRLYMLAEEAFLGYLKQVHQQGQQGINVVIDQQLIGFFIDGLLSDALK